MRSDRFLFKEHSQLCTCVVKLSRSKPDEPNKKARYKSLVTSVTGLNRSERNLHHAAHSTHTAHSTHAAHAARRHPRHRGFVFGFFRDHRFGG